MMARMASLASQALLLASMHAQRSSIVYRGWRPWRKLVETQRRLRHEADMFNG